MTTNQVSVGTFFNKITQDELKNIKAVDNEVADTDNKEWIVRYVGDCETEYMRLFKCEYSELYLKILDDELFKGMLEFKVDQIELLVGEVLIKKAKEAIEKQTHGVRVVPLSKLKSGLSVQMRMGGYN